MQKVAEVRLTVLSGLACMRAHVLICLQTFADCPLWFCMHTRTFSDV